MDYKHKIAEITWVDSCGAHGWSDKARAANESMTIRSIGFVVHDDKESITISTSTNPSSCHSPVTIPRIAIKKLKVRK